MDNKKKASLIKYKLIFTALIIFTYIIGKNLPLYGVNTSVYADKILDAESLLTQTISGDLYKCSLFALGVSPYMLANILVQGAFAIKGKEERNTTSPIKRNRITLCLTMIFAFVQAIMNLEQLVFWGEGYYLLVAQVVAVAEMVAGSTIIMWLAVRNSKYGLGGQSALIFINILEGIITNVSKATFNEMIIPGLISLIGMIIILIMENTELRIPLQRISIHNIYADKNYIAIKLSPIGIMPAMFATAFFMLPQFIITGMNYLIPNNPGLEWGQANMTLSYPLGIATYIVILYILSIGFSRLFINPSDITDDFLKSGDSIMGVHAGKDTKKYISKAITRLSLLSATILAVCLGIPLVLQMNGSYVASLASLPSSIMMLVGVFCNIYREAISVKDLDSYKPFI